MTVAWLDCGSGAAGDMLLGALLDAGAPLDAVRSAVDAVSVAGAEPVRLSVEPALRGGLAGTRVRVEAPADPIPRTWADLRELLGRATLPDAVRAQALEVFGRLADAEAAAHGTAADDVHFHEVGALDAIVDVVGGCAAVQALGIERVVASRVALGQGSVESAHGTLPVPAPAVLSLLASAGAPVESGPQPYEMCTPTGAALLATWVDAWGGLPPGRVLATGNGAGARDLPGRPNVVRVVLLEPTASTSVDAATEAVLLATNVDDLDPRLWPSVLARLLAAGADDAWLTPILMKKGRPAHTLSVLVAPAAADAVRRTVFRETSALGLREQVVGKRALERSFVEVVVAGRAVRVKVATLDGEVVNRQPEWDDVAAVADATGRPAKLVLAEAVAAAATARADEASGTGPETEKPERHRRGMQ